MKTSKWWDGKRGRMSRFITSNTDALEAVKFAQTSSKCAFDHRRGYSEKVSGFKMQEILKRFKLPDIKESEFSVEGTVKDGYSNMFLTHLYFYLNIMKNFNGVPKKILEIGAGYGGLARIFKILHPEIEYTVLDLEESIYFSRSFLKLNGLDASYVSSEDTQSLIGQEFDVAINTFSFQEMPEETILSYVDLVQTGLKVKGFYTCNYYKNDKITKEQSYDGELPVDGSWSELYIKDNAPILQVDSPKNFRELYLERVA